MNSTSEAMQDIDALELTKQRRSVLRVIRESERHLTANEVFDDARRLLPGISFATVYNSLRYLTKEGLIGEIRFGKDANLYDRKLTPHDHAICTKCGELVDIEMEHPQELINRAAKISKVKPESLEFTLRGICSKCAKD
jgi:Fur family transcriptional regulator, peroxide stress response regulator